MRYSQLVRVYQELEKTTKRLEKTDIISEFIKEIPSSELADIIYLLQGRIFPSWDERKIGFSSRLILKAISAVSGKSVSMVEQSWATHGDLGIVAEKLLKKKTQLTINHKLITTQNVIKNIRRLPELEGQGTVSKKIGYITELLSNAKPEESKYIVKTVLENLRIGIAEGVIKNAIAKAFNKKEKQISEAADKIVDYGEVAVLAKKDELNKASLKPGRPVKLMLAISAKDVKQCFEDLDKKIQFEEKIDGFRIQVHKTGGATRLFTRNMEDVTKQFPDIVKSISSIKGKNFIIDAEAAGIDKKTGRSLPFQNISQRIKRKYDIERMTKELPIQLFIFDILYYNGKSMINEQLIKRRKLLEKIVSEKKGKIAITNKIITEDEREASKFFHKVIAKGNEGLMAKNLKSIYRPGRYVKGWMKLKKILDPLDLVISKAEFGEGKRAGWLTSFTISCQSKGKFLDIGKASTGVKEKSQGLTYKELTKILKPDILSQKGKETELKPAIVLEIGYEEIQKSPTYNSGFALRFPRIIRRRLDKPVKEIVTLKEIEKIYHSQRGQK